MYAGRAEGRCNADVSFTACGFVWSYRSIRAQSSINNNANCDPRDVRRSSLGQSMQGPYDVK